MRSLIAALLAAQKAASGVPYVRVVVENNMRNIRHLVFTQTFSDGEGDDKHDAVADNTYLHRVRVSGGRPQRTRVAGGWSDLNAFNDGAQIAVDAINNARVIAVYNRGAALYFRESTDQGGSWGAETLIFTLGAVPKAVCVAYKTAGGDLCAVWEESNNLRRVRRISGAWGGATTWSQTASSLNGVDMILNGDFHIVVTGVEATTLRPTLWSLILGDGFAVSVDTWASFFIQQQAESDELVTFQAPYIARPDTTRVTFVEKFTGTGAYTRTYLTMLPLLANFSPGEWEWQDPAPLDNITANGYAIAWNTTKVYYSRPAQILEALRANVSLDMSAALVEATIEEVDGLHQRAELVFDNSGGAYAGPPSPIALHRDVNLGLGYDANVSLPPRQYIEGWEYRRSGGKSLFVLKTRGVDLWLGRYRPRTTMVVASRKMTQIARGTAGRAGLEVVNVGNSSRSANFNLTWTIHPHLAHLATIEALLAIMPDVLFTVGVSLVLNEPLAGDSIDYTYGTDHSIYQSRTRNEHAASVAEVLGDGALGQAFDFTAQNHDKPLEDRRRDPNETAEADADAVASARLRKAVLATDKGELVTPVNCGLEVNDVVAYTDTLVNPAQQKARVRGITTRFRRAGAGPAVYEQTVKLGGV